MLTMDAMAPDTVVFELTRSQFDTLADMANYPAGAFRREATLRKLAAIDLVETRFVPVYMRELWFRTPKGDNLARQPWSKLMTLTVADAGDTPTDSSASASSVASA